MRQIQTLGGKFRSRARSRVFVSNPLETMTSVGAPVMERSHHTAPPEAMGGHNLTLYS